MNHGRSENIIESTALTTSQPGSSFVQLSPGDSGIDFENEVNQKELILSQVATHSGLASGDIDADGDLDIYLVGVNSGNKLYRNDGSFKFTDITGESDAGLDGGEKLGACAAFADLNGDGHLDIYVGNSDAGNDLYLGDGTGRFSDASAESGANDPRATTSTALFDADEDGDLDIYVCNYAMTTTAPSVLQSLIPPEGQRAVIPDSLKDEIYVDDKGWPRHRPDRDSFLLNDGSGHFTDETEARGLDYVSYSFQAQACDLNNDGHDDLYVTSDFETPDRALFNDGSGKFTLATADHFRKTALYGMGADSSDVNNDGLVDLFVADMSARGKQRSKRQSGDMNEWRWQFMNEDPQPQMRNMLFINTGDGWMSEVASFAGVKSSDWTWATRFADMDCDGFEDLYCATGFTRDAMDVDTTNAIQQMISTGSDAAAIQDFILYQPMYRVQDYIFRNKGDVTFDTPDNNWGITEETYSAGVSLADYDNDGDPDLIINYTKDIAGVFRNDVAQGKRLTIDLAQDGANAHAIGARVWAQVGNQVLSRDVIISRGFATGESTRLHFGLGDATRIDRLEIRWPDNMLQTVETGLEAGQHYTIHRASDLTKWQAPAPEPYFTTTQTDWEQLEVDTAAREFEKEPLLPFQQSTLGTGLALLDLDDDSQMELLFGGAAGQDGVWLERSEDGSWSEFDSKLQEILGSGTEVTGICVLDANADGRRDLLICSGGIEGREVDGSSRNFLLLNMEDGLHPQRLPVDFGSSGRALASDIDNDGDLDLLLCGHVLAYQYAITDRNHLLLNDGKGNYSDAGAAQAAGLADLSQVADALFHDMDGDGWQDLVLARHWGAVELWHNSEGSFSHTADITKRGWWRGLAIADFNNDGQADVIACNTGLNSKYHPSEGRPLTLFCNDFDDNGTRDLVEVSYSTEGDYLPGRGRSCSGYAIRTIPRRFPTWTEFSNASFMDVYGDHLEGAEKYEADMLESVICLAEGDSYRVIALPGAAQWTPAFSAAVADYDNDGNLDCYLAGNFTQTQPETGQWDSGYGTLLLGSGDGSFRVVEVPLSGIRIYQDQRGSVAGDIDLDGNADLVVAMSNGHPRIALGSGTYSRGSGLNVRLKGRNGNLDGYGARLELTLDDGRVLYRSMDGSGSYFAASTAPVHFGIPAGSNAVRLLVKWADGSVSESDVGTGDVILEIIQE